MEKRLQKEKKEKKERGISYFELALLAFGGLGIEVAYMIGIEPLIYGHEANEFTTPEMLIHWTITCITWIIVIWLILRYAKNKLDFNLLGNNQKVKPLGWVISIAIVVAVTVMNYFDVGAIKIIHEFNRLGALKFIFQHIYYFVEIGLVTLVTVFGQVAMEKWFKNDKIPFGGIVLGLTWGMVHWLTKGSFLIGIEGLIIGFFFGCIYLLLNRDIRKTYIVLVLAFIL